MMHRQQNIDTKLATPGQQAIREVVRALPDETVSMAWRSGLNEELLKVSVRRRQRQRLAWLLRPALGLGVAGALAVIVMTHSQFDARPAPLASSRQAAVEAALLVAHDDATRYADVTGAGLSSSEAASDAIQPQVGSSDWSEVDAESL